MPRSGPGPAISRPCTRIWPASAGMKPPRMWSSVLFPQPLGPTTVTNSPSATDMLPTSSTSMVRPSLANALRSATTSRAGPLTARRGAARGPPAYARAPDPRAPPRARGAAARHWQGADGRERQRPALDEEVEPGPHVELAAGAGHEPARVAAAEELGEVVDAVAVSDHEAMGAVAAIHGIA